MKKNKKKSAKRQIASSMGQAAGLLKTEKRILQDAARRGAPGFLSSGRIDVELLGGWLAANPQRKAETQPPPAPEEMEELRTIEASRQAAIDEEIAARRALAAARQAGATADLPALSQTYAIARRGRMMAEKAVREEQTRAGELLTVSAHKIQLHRAWTPIITTMRMVPRKAAQQVGGEDEARAEKIIAEAVEAAIADSSRTINPKPEDAHFCFTLWQALMMREDPTGATALTKIRAALVELEGAIATTAAATSKPA